MSIICIFITAGYHSQVGEVESVQAFWPGALVSATACFINTYHKMDERDPAKKRWPQNSPHSQSRAETSSASLS